MKLFASVAMVALLLPCAASAGTGNVVIGSVTVTSNRTSYDGKCPVQIVFTGVFTVTFPQQGGKVSYSWARSDKTSSPWVESPLTSGIHQFQITDTMTLVSGMSHVFDKLTVRSTSDDSHIQQTPDITVVCR